MGVVSGGLGFDGRGRVLLDGDWDEDSHLEVLALLDLNSRSGNFYYEDLN